MPKVKEIILGVTGSIAAYKACDLIRRFQEEGCRVAVVMTREAEQFITPLSLATLSGHKVFRDTSDEFKNAWDMPHIALAQRADVLLIAPATANIIGKLACGIADNLLSCLAISTKAKIFIAPAMNTEMYGHAIVRENMAKLKKLGVEFIGPAKGKLACGVIGEGHLADVEEIVTAVARSFKTKN